MRLEAVDNVALKIPARREYSELLRLAIVGIASRLGFNLDEIEDIKLGVNEAFIIAVHDEEQDNFEVTFEIHPNRLEIVIDGLAAVKALEQEQYKTFGFSLLHAVMDSVEWEQAGSERLRLVKRKG